VLRLWPVRATPQIKQPQAIRGLGFYADAGAVRMNEHVRPWGLLNDYKTEIKRLRAALLKIRVARQLAEAKKTAGDALR